MKTVIFVSDSNLDVYSNRALIGTEAYRSFLELLAYFDLSINDSLLYNETDFRTIEAIATADMSVRVITLGSTPERMAKELNIPYYALPSIDKLPAEQSLDFKTELRECREFINDYSVN